MHLSQIRFDSRMPDIYTSSQSVNYFSPSFLHSYSRHLQLIRDDFGVTVVVRKLLAYHACICKGGVYSFPGPANRALIDSDSYLSLSIFTRCDWAAPGLGTTNLLPFLLLLLLRPLTVSEFFWTFFFNFLTTFCQLFDNFITTF
jgi:hypothetical protein